VIRNFFFTACLVVLGTLSVWGQAPAEHSLMLPVVVTEKNGGACASSVTADALDFIDNGSAMASVKLTRARELPVRYLLLANVSNSTARQ
jgi:hypothetical protein